MNTHVSLNSGSSHWAEPHAEPQALSNNHRHTLLKLFQHPINHNIEWAAVLSVLEAVASVERLRDGKLVIHLGTETEVFSPAKDKDINAQQVVDLRRMFVGAGYGALIQELRAKGEEV